jgi:hypothetical protein
MCVWHLGLSSDETAANFLFPVTSQNLRITETVHMMGNTINAVCSSKSSPRSSCPYITTHSFPSYFNFRYRGQWGPLMPFYPLQAFRFRTCQWQHAYPCWQATPLALLKHATRITFSLPLGRSYTPVCRYNCFICEIIIFVAGFNYKEATSTFWYSVI